MTDCPCGSNQALDQCCMPVIRGNQRAQTAEILMRARYTAHTLAEMEFIFATHHPSTRSDIDESATTRWAQESSWLGLEILSVEGGGSEDTTGRIEFIARYRDGARRRHTHHERGVFERYHGQWYFRDAQLPDVNQVRRDHAKQGRNELCACGSGKKYKKCCALA